MKTTFLSRLTQGALVEMIFTVVIIISMMMSWMYYLAPFDILSPRDFMESLGDIAGEDSSDINDDAMTFAHMLLLAVIVCIAICIINVILKFFRRSRWLSIIVVIGASIFCALFFLMYLGAKESDEYSFRLKTGFYVCLVGIIGLIVGLCLPSKPLCEEK